MATDRSVNKSLADERSPTPPKHTVKNERRPRDGANRRKHRDHSIDKALIVRIPIGRAGQRQDDHVERVERHRHDGDDGHAVREADGRVLADEEGDDDPGDVDGNHDDVDKIGAAAAALARLLVHAHFGVSTASSLFDVFDVGAGAGLLGL